MPQTQQHSALSTRVAVPCARDTPAMEPRWRRRSKAVLISLLIGFAYLGSARATVTIEINSADYDESEGVYRKTVVMDPTYWTDFSENCALVNAGSSCDSVNQPDPNPGNLLFSWGQRGDARNSKLEVNFNLDRGDEWSLDTITFDTTPHAQPLGPDVSALNVGPSSVPFASTTGLGTMVAYERDLNIINVGASGASIHDVTHQRMDISASYNGNAASASVNDWYVAIDQATPPSDSTDFLVTNPEFAIAQKPFTQVPTHSTAPMPRSPPSPSRPSRGRSRKFAPRVDGSWPAMPLTVPLHLSRAECGKVKISGCLLGEHRRRHLAQ